MIRIILISLVTLLAACSSNISENVAIFKYEDFGPPVIASEVIGMDWWQWQKSGDSRPKKYSVQIVVYKGISLEKVKNKYPVVAEEEKDYRYLEYSNAVKYLDRVISENVIEKLTTKLIKTRENLANKLGD